MSGLMFVSVLSVCNCPVPSAVTFIACCCCYRRYCTRSHYSSLSDCTPISPGICYSAVQHTLCRLSLCIILLPIPGMLIWCDLLSRKIVYTVCTCCLFLFVTFFVAGYFVSNALSCPGIVSFSVPSVRSPLDKHKIVLVAVCQIFSTLHTAPYNFPCFFPCPSNSLFLGNFGLGGFDFEFRYYYYYYYYYYY